MVKLSQKSKRQTCKKRYRIEKRIRDHNKKTRKEAKAGEKKLRKKIKKTFSIPNKFPFKEELLDKAEKQKQAEIELKKKKKDERKKLKVDGKLSEKNPNFKLDSSSLDDLVRQVQKKQNIFDKFAHKNPFDTFANMKTYDQDRETSLKSFYKEFRKVVEASDVIIEVLDARDPLGSRCPQVEEMILSSGQNKKLILLLNKIDLVPKLNVQEWLKYLRNQYPTVAFKASTQNQNEKLSQSSVPINLASDNLLSSSKCLGADILVKLLNNYTRINDVKQTITVGIIGLPNVGKSSVINSLKRSAACLIGSTPGLTRCMKEIKLDKHIKLLDCPGIVMSRDEDTASLVLKNCIKIENVVDLIAPVDLLLKRCNKEQLILRYKIGEFSDANEFLTLVAKRCGKIKKTGIPDIAKAAHLILNDWTSGKLSYYTQPPELAKPTETKIVTEFSKPFDIDELFKEAEEKLFDSIDDTKIIVDGVEATSLSPTKVNFEKLEKDEEDEEEDDDEEEIEEDEEEEDEMIEESVEEEETKDDNKKKVQFKNAINDKNNKKSKKNLDSDNDEKEIYKNENIPRTKKMAKIQKKTIKKKQKRNEKLVSNLGSMIGEFNFK